MKIKFALVFFMLSSCSFLFSQNDTILKLFRSTLLGKQKITLQSNVSTIKGYAIKSDNNHYFLKKGTYGIADSIGIEVNSVQQIISILFTYEYAPEYSNDTAYIHELHKYQKLINSKGREYQYTSKNISIKVTKWEDKGTIFELIETRIDNKTQAYSVIFDKELYYKKVKSCIDLNKSENSIELLKRIGLI